MMHFSFRSCWRTTVLLSMALLAGCQVNPVTGDRELGFISENEEVALGEQHYSPMQQSQGGLYKADPALSEYVDGVGQRLVQVSDRQLPYEFVVLNNSVPNAWALPGGKIAINRGLLVELGSEAELAAVLGHEIVHSAARHGAQNMERGMLLQGALLATAVAARNSEYAGFLVGGAQVGAQLINQRYGRDAEREADRYGTRYMAEAGYAPGAAVDLQETFVRLSENRQQNWLEGLFASHPPSTERVQNNRELAEALRAEGFTGGDRGEQRYQEQMSFLHDAQPAYDAFDQAQALLRQDRPGEAMEQVETALEILPQEARFHGLRADILLSRGDHQQAISDYDQAIELDPEYYDYYLGRGMAYQRQGNRSRAEQDFQASANLLPTAQAMNELGALALQQGQRQEAKQYYQQAADAPGEIGDRARASFVRLDIVDNPASYIRSGVGLNDQRRLLVRVRNESPIAINAATIVVQGVVAGQSVGGEIAVPAMGAGQSHTLDTGLTIPPDTAAADAEFRVTVRRVQPD